MSGITSSTGLFSGIDTSTLIQQLLSLEARPKALAQSRLIEIQGQKAAYLDINSRIDALGNLASSFRTENIFQNKAAAVSNASVLSATASQNAAAGSYSFIVDRLVTTQQVLTRGFTDTDTSAIGLESLTFEGEEASLRRDTSLSDLNDGDGITRGTIEVTVGATVTEVDLSRAATVDDVLDKLNDVPGVTAYADNNRLVIEGIDDIENADDADVLGSLGLDGAIVGQTLTGSSVYGLHSGTALSTLNDGRGVGYRTTTGASVYDFSITLDPGGADLEVRVRIGDVEENVDDELTVTDPAETTVGGVLGRINAAIEDAGLDSELSATIDQSTGGIKIVDSLGRDIEIEDYTSSGSSSTAASDLGIAGTYSGGTAQGSRVFAGINTTLISSLNGGSGIEGTDGLVNFTAADGTSFSVDVSALNDVNDLINAVNNHASNNGRIVASYNESGNGLAFSDTTTGGDTFEISGTSGFDTAEALGIAGLYASGSVSGSNLQLAYIGTATRLDTLNNGSGVGSGTFEIIDSNNNRVEVNISATDTTLADVIRRINNTTADVNARINDTGDGIVIEDTGGGGANLEISDTDGSVASKLGISGTSTGTGADNILDGSQEIAIDIDATSTLQEIIDAINSSGADVSASVINTGSGSAPYRLSITSRQSGSEGRFIIDSGDFDLGVNTLDEGNDARVFFGSSDPANAVLISSSSNQLEGVIEGVSINLLAADEEPVEISVTSDTSAVEAKIQEFVDAFNSAVDQIDFQTRYDEETEARGTLLGDGTINSLRNAMFNSVLRSNSGFTSTYDSLTQVGITIGEESELVFDSAAFREAISEDPEAVEALFTRRVVDTDAVDDDPNTDDELVFSELGVFAQFEQFTDRYTDSIFGILENRTSAFDAQIVIQEERIERFDERLEARRQILSAQFLAMEQAIASFQSQGNALSQIASVV